MSVERPIRVPVHGHRWRTAITLLLLIAVVGGGAWYGWRALRDTTGTTGTTVSACTSGGRRIQASAISLNVYNSTSRDGMAARTAEGLRSRGFQIAKVADYPGKYVVQGVAVIRSSKAARFRMALVHKQVPKASLSYDKRTTLDVDLILGRRFSTLSTQPTARAGTC